MGVKRILIGAVAFLSFSNVLAQSVDRPADTEPAAVLEMGGAANRNLKEQGWSWGPALAVEVTPIENWLELETGVSVAFGRHSTEWDLDFLLKKPWSFSDKVELMVGIGPAWNRTKQNAITVNSASAEAVLDFMFWPSARHRLGWYVEPAYEYSFGRAHEGSLGVSGGLLIAFR